MAATQNKIMHRRLVSSYVSSVLSTSLVLLLTGLASLLLVNAGNVSDYFKENMEISVIFRQEASDKDIATYQKELQAQPWLRKCEYISKEQGREEMKRLLGEDFLSVFETAPIPVSFDISLAAEYVTPEKTEEILAGISRNPIVDDVVWQKDLIEVLNSNIRTISYVLSVFIALLMFISFVLINNTIRLSLYNRRFTVHTMRLVGATKAFIRKPFLLDALFQGIISAELAILILVASLIVVKSEFPLMFTMFQLRELLYVMAIMLSAGIVVCVGASFVVVGRMVNLKNEELYF